MAYQPGGRRDRLGLGELSVLETRWAAKQEEGPVLSLTSTWQWVCQARAAPR